MLPLSNIDHFIEALSTAEVSEDTCNEYAGSSSDATIRRANLKRYLLDMIQRHPKVLLVMEAPGYRGCRLTGVPVTSRKILLEGLPELELFGEAHGYQNTADAGFENIYGEQSATIVWSTLTQLRRVPLIWNTYPFHPHKPDLPRSNRKPRKPETDLGADYLRFIIRFYKPEVIVAVGNVAHNTMTGMGINCLKVRHPAQGGKAEFVSGLYKILS